MPKTAVCAYREADGHVPVRTWLRELRMRDQAAYEKCRRAFDRLAAFGWELRRPHVDYLRDAIYELRVRSGHVQFRVLYFFQGRNVVVLAAALAKTDVVPEAEIERAIRRRHDTEADPETHLLKEWSVDEP
jgi:phage-related protein